MCFCFLSVMIDQNVPCHPDYSPRFLKLFPLIDQIAKWNLIILFKLPKINELVVFRSFIFKSCERVINYSIVAIIADMFFGTTYTLSTSCVLLVLNFIIPGSWTHLVSQQFDTKHQMKSVPKLLSFSMFKS